jgi:hypothetical protein
MGPDGQHRDHRVVPIYAFTRGRTRSTGQDLPLEAVVTPTAGAEMRVQALQTESAAIVRLCARPMSVAELGVALQVPVGVARVLVGDLVSAGCLAVHMPRSTREDGGPTHAILGRLLEGLRAR